MRDLSSSVLMPAQNIKKGNVEIRKTIEVNRSTQKYIFVLLLAATLGVLLLDWCADTGPGGAPLSGWVVMAARGVQPEHATVVCVCLPAPQAQQLTAPGGRGGAGQAHGLRGTEAALN